MSSVPSATPLLELRNVSKEFGGTQALQAVNLTIMPGQVHGLLGENGSGKSTLIKILAGFHEPDAGSELLIDGEPVPLPLPPAAVQAHAISFVHQDLALISSLTALENLLIGQMATRRGFHISWPRERVSARALFERFGLDIEPDMLVSQLRPVERAMLAIVRAFDRRTAGAGSSRKRLLVLDEPTVFLPSDSTEQLFALVREVVADGSSVLFVSHDLDEVLELTDVVTVLRDGRVRATVPTSETDRAELVELIVGRQLTDVVRREPQAGDRPIVASVDDVTTDLVRGASLSIRAGEVLGITGVIGSGFEELLYAIFGAWPSTQGTLHVGGASIDLARHSPRRATRAGMALIPADRPRLGSIGSLPVSDNISMQVLDRYSSTVHIRQRKMTTDSLAVIDAYDIRPKDPGVRYSALSGGNQQKVLLAKWLRTEPSVLLLHEPTQGVDVGARHEIFRTIRSLAASGTAVVCASADHEQLAEICDRVLIFVRGSVAHELVGADVSKHRISEASYLTSASRGEHGV